MADSCSGVNATVNGNLWTTPPVTTIPTATEFRDHTQTNVHTHTHNTQTHTQKRERIRQFQHKNGLFLQNRQHVFINILVNTTGSLKMVCYTSTHTHTHAQIAHHDNLHLLSPQVGRSHGNGRPVTAAMAGRFRGDRNPHVTKALYKVEAPFSLGVEASSLRVIRLPGD